jgi:hypothetical protein
VARADPAAAEGALLDGTAAGRVPVDDGLDPVDDGLVAAAPEALRLDLQPVSPTSTSRTGASNGTARVVQVACFTART